MKKITFWAILLALLILLAACGGSDDNTKNESSDGAQQEGESDGGDTDDGDNTDIGNADTDDFEKDDTTDEGDSGNMADPTSPIKIQKGQDGKITIDFLIPESANKDVSIVLISDESVPENWQTNLEKVVAIEQLSANEHGEGSVTVKAAPSDAYAVIVSYSGGSESAVWKK